MITADKVYSLTQTKTQVDVFLDEFLATELQRATVVDPSYQQMLAIMQSYLAAGGKHLRPHLAILTYQGYGGQKTPDILPVASAWELLHAALLVHDDIIDRDDMRHGALNIFGRYCEVYNQAASINVEHYALSSALLAGDLLISYSQQIVLNAKLDADAKVAILQLLNEAIFMVGGGELLDAESVLYPLDATNARTIALYKTAGYTFQLPLLSGAVLAGVDGDDLRSLRKIGEKLGIAFQLVDDVLGVFGQAQQTGKYTVTDIRERKRTVLVQEACNRLNKEQQQELIALYDVHHEMSQQDIMRALELLTISGAKNAVMHEAKQLSEEAQKLIRELSMHENAKQALLDLITKMLSRNS
jgi:geranylgeranyl diphosphate synthase type II